MTRVSDKMSIWLEYVSVREIQNPNTISQVGLRDGDITLTMQSNYCLSNYFLLIYNFWAYTSLKLSRKQIL